MPRFHAMHQDAMFSEEAREGHLRSAQFFPWALALKTVQVAVSQAHNIRDSWSQRGRIGSMCSPPQTTSPFECREDNTGHLVHSTGSAMSIRIHFGILQSVSANSSVSPNSQLPTWLNPSASQLPQLLNCSMFVMSWSLCNLGTGDTSQ